MAELEVPNVSEAETTIITTVLPTPIGMSSTMAPGATTAISPTSDTCTDNIPTPTTATTLTTSSSTTFITSASTTSSTSSRTSSSTNSIISFSSASNAVPASATLVAPAASSIPITSISRASGPIIGSAGIAGLSVSLGIVFAAIIALFCHYRRKRRFHKEAMLIAPRLSQHKNHRSIETGNETLVGSGSISGNFEKDINLGVIHPKEPVRQVTPSMSSDAACLMHDTYPPRSSSLTSSTVTSTDGLGPVMTEQISLGNDIYGIRYNTGGILSVEYETAEQTHPAGNVNPPGFDEALARLNAIHEAAIRRELSPPPLRIVQRSALNPEDQIQPSPRVLLNPTHLDLESISELDISDIPRHQDIERRRAAALAKLEGKVYRYTESVYSRSSDGTPFRRPEDKEGRPQWKDLQRHSPD